MTDLFINYGLFLIVSMGMFIIISLLYLSMGECVERNCRLSF